MLTNSITYNRMTRKVIFIALAFTLLFPAISISQAIAPKMDFNKLQDYLNRENDTTYVVNFWATWCAPCIKELPYFEDLNTEMANHPVKVYLVSLDFPRHYESKLLPFIESRGIRSSVLYLDDGKANEWIPKVDKEWTGAIPATLIYKGKESKFIEGSISKEELYKAVGQIMSY